MNKVSKDYYALNLTDKQTDRLITKVEADITILMQEISTKTGPLREAEQYYMELKREHDAIQDELNDSKSLLEALTRFKTNARGSKEIRVLRTTSVTESKEKKRRHFKWIQMAIEVLTKEDKYMSHEELWKKMLTSFPEIEKAFNGDKQKLNQVKNTTFHNFNRACEESRKNNSGKLIDYQKKIGLFGWTLDNLAPDPQHIKEFMHGGMRAAV
jgi:hypothetical protein